MATSDIPMLCFRSARAGDLERIVCMLAEDPLGQQRERFELPLPEAYASAFAAIEADPGNQILVAEQEGQVVAFLQLTIIPNLTYQGRPRAQIEGVRVAREQRGTGLGSELVQEAVRRARDQDCHLVPLSTDKRRPDAVRFYQKLGFVASHEGMKLHL